MLRAGGGIKRTVAVVHIEGNASQRSRGWPLACDLHLNPTCNCLEVKVGGSESGWSSQQAPAIKHFPVSGARAGVEEMVCFDGITPKEKNLTNE